MSPVATETEIDVLVKEKLMPMRNRVLDALEKKHPHLFAVINPILANQKNKFGLQVMENGRIVGEYVLHLGGLRVSNVETGKLDSEVHHPLMGLIKPYLSVERRTLERIIADEKNLQNELFSTISQYLPDLTIKFLR